MESFKANLFISTFCNRVAHAIWHRPSCHTQEQTTATICSASSLLLLGFTLTLKSESSQIIHSYPWRVNTLNPARLFSCLLDTTSTIPASTSTSAAVSGCSIPRRRGRFSITLLVSTKRTEDSHSQVNCTSKIVLTKWISDFHSQVNSRCASKCTSDFHSKVNCTSKIVLANYDFWLSLKSQHEHAIQVHTQECATQVHGQVHL